MKILHAKSPCCRGSVNRFGKRRRQCAICKHTWRIRQKHRGRKRKRTPAALAIRTLINGRAYYPRQGSISQSGFSRRLSKTIQRIVHSPKPRFPSGPCALIGDGMYFKFRRMEWVMYLMAVKPIRSHKAHFLDPVLLEGKEHAERWKQAIAAMPPVMRKHIAAFVSDGFRGSQALSEQHGWLHQRCHFHLLSALVRGKGKRRYQLRGSRLRDRILETTRVILCSRNAAALQKARGNLKRFIGHPVCPRYIRKHGLEFLERERDFRSYLLCPELNLPTTTNAIESAVKLIRKATGTARTPQSVLARATACLRLRKSITCNGHFSTKLCQ